MICESIIEAVVSEMLACFKESDGFFSKTRDMFATRTQSYILETKKYLEAAIFGEIGNNTFDHNFGFESNYPWGAYCNLSYKQKYIVLADYGRGIRQSLLPVLTSIGSDREAIETAFTKRISGRSPEQRGNGLKFVSDAIQQNNWHLFFQSGTGSCSIDESGIKFLERPIPLTGCLAILDFSEGS
ncbi:MAG: hypothetical protein LBH07_03085 [Treponema sp.]|jgi:hypothetical protein|nr:hypothetical protein [Treponema sp.]